MNLEENNNNNNNNGSEITDYIPANIWNLLKDK
jgi:hypothetical protein